MPPSLTTIRQYKAQFAQLPPQQRQAELNRLVAQEQSVFNTERYKGAVGKVKSAIGNSVQENVQAYQLAYADLQRDLGEQPTINVSNIRSEAEIRGDLARQQVRTTTQPIFQQALPTREGVRIGEGKTFLPTGTKSKGEFTSEGGVTVRTQVRQKEFETQQRQREQQISKGTNRPTTQQPLPVTRTSTFTKFLLTPPETQKPLQTKKTPVSLVAKEFGGNIQPTTKTGVDQFIDNLSKGIYGKPLDEINLFKFSTENEGRTLKNLPKTLLKGTKNLLELASVPTREAINLLTGKPIQDPQTTAILLSQSELAKTPETRTTVALGLTGLTELIPAGKFLKIGAKAGTKLFTLTKLGKGLLQGTTGAVAVRQAVISAEDKAVVNLAQQAQEDVEKTLSLPKRLALAISPVALDPFTDVKQQVKARAEELGRQQGLTPEQISRVLPARQTLAVGELTNIFNIERQIELFGRTRIAKGFADFAKANTGLLTKEQALAIVKKITNFTFSLGGTAEGVSQVISANIIRGQPIEFSEVALGGALGSVGARLFGVPVAQKQLKKAVGTAYEVIGQGIDFPGEIFGDIFGETTQQLRSALTKIGFRTPTIQTVIPKGSTVPKFRIGTIKEGGGVIKTGIRTPVNPFTSAISPSSSESLKLELPSSLTGSPVGQISPRQSIKINVGTPSKQTKVPDIFKIKTRTPSTSLSKSLSSIPNITKTPVPDTVPGIVPGDVPSKVPDIFKPPQKTDIPNIFKTRQPNDTPAKTPVPIPITTLTPNFPLPLGFGEFYGGGKAKKVGLKQRFKPSLFGIVTGKRVKKIPVGQTFTGFEVRGVPTGQKLGGIFSAVTSGKKSKSGGFDIGFGGKTKFVPVRSNVKVGGFDLGFGRQKSLKTKQNLVPNVRLNNVKLFNTKISPIKIKF